MYRAAVLLLAIAVTSCGEVLRQDTASSYLIITRLEGGSGAQPGSLSGTVESDVITVVDNVPTIFADPGSVTFQLAMKDPGGPGNPSAPSTANFITINRYRVRFIRSDGRNTPGVDVPYGFDGAFTVTVSSTSSAAFTLVRHQAKEEAPLAALAATGQISTIAEVTFYGQDQTGREVSVSGQISVNFANFGDPKSGSQG